MLKIFLIETIKGEFEEIKKTLIDSENLQKISMN